MNQEDEARRHPDADSVATVSGTRRAYRRPELIEYGPLAKLTQGSGSGTGEFTPTGEKMMKCL